MRQDFRLAWRALRRRPLLTLIVGSTLALGIGVTGAVFGLVDVLLLRPVPGVTAPEELVSVHGTRRGSPEALIQLTYADFRDYDRGTTEVLSGLAAYAEASFALSAGEPSVRVPGVAVSTDYFQVLGVQPHLGSFAAFRDQPTPAVVVLGYDYWHGHLDADPDILGRRIDLNGEPLTVVAVAPRGFRGVDLVFEASVWVPLGQFKQLARGIFAQLGGVENRQQAWLRAVGRVAPGQQLEQAQLVFDALSGSLAEAYPEVAKGRGAKVLPLAQVAFGRGMRGHVVRYAGLLLAVTGLLLLVTCLNVAGLLVAHGLTRDREMAVRRSVGAGTWNLVRLLLFENLGLALLGGLGGLGLAAGLLPLLSRLHLPLNLDAAAVTPNLDLRFAALVFALAVASGLIFGVLAALRTARVDLRTMLQGGYSRSARWTLFGMRDLLVTGQIALCGVVLVAAVLLLSTWRNLDAVETGYEDRNLLLASLDPEESGYPAWKLPQFYDKLRQRLERLPGVDRVSQANALPMLGAGMAVELTVEPYDYVPPEEAAAWPSAKHAMVGPGFFATAGVKLLHGRTFQEMDGPDAPAVVLVNETLAREFWPDQPAIGRQLELYDTPEPFEVIGVVADCKYASLRESPRPTLFLAFSQWSKSKLGPMLMSPMTVMVHADGAPGALAADLRNTVEALDSMLPVFDLRTLDETRSAAMRSERQLAALFGSFAIFTLCLAMFGLFGVLTHAVLCRRREMGIRLALGARPRDLRRLVVRRALVLCVPGILGGLAAALALSSFLSGHLFGLGAADPATYVKVALTLIGFALLASHLPARRAGRLAPESLLKEA